MPTELDHIALANRNHSALQHLLADTSQYSEWVATTAFYKAVQLVEAMLSRQGMRSHDHATRHSRLKTSYPEIWKHYRVLWQASCVARYLHDNDTQTSFTSFSDYIQPASVEKKLVLRRLRPVEQLVVSNLSDDSRRVLERIPS